MFDIRTLRDDPDAVRAALQKRHTALDLDAVIEVDAQRRKLVHEMEMLRAEQNKAGQEIAQRKKAKGHSASPKPRI